MRCLNVCDQLQTARKSPRKPTGVFRQASSSKDEVKLFCKTKIRTHKFVNNYRIHIIYYLYANYRKLTVVYSSNGNVSREGQY